MRLSQLSAMRRSGLAVVVVGTVLVGFAPRQAAAAVTSVRGSACGYFVNVGLFGGPQTLKGCGQDASQPATSASPSVTLPPTGSAAAVTADDPDGAAAQSGPAIIFGGIWPYEVAAAPPSGPMSASTQGTPALGTVTSSARISLHPTPVKVRCYGDPAGTANCNSPGGFGPFPVQGDSVHVSCSASETAVSGTTTFSNASLATATDGEGEPTVLEPVPDNPPPNYTRHGVITNVGDVFTVVYNEQIINADGSITVNGAHMYLFGPTAVGEVVKGSVTCGTTPSSVSRTDSRAPTCGTPVVKPMGPEDPTPQVPRQELIGVFDTRGLQSITNIHSSNASVQVGEPASDFAYLRFTPGQTGPLAMTATQIDQTRTMRWSFDATDVAGNVTHCQGVVRAAADFNGNGSTDVAVYRPNGNAWFVQGGLTTGWGVAGDVPVPADYDGDGDTDVAVFRTSDQTWYVQGGIATQWGIPGDIPIPADFNGDRKADIAVFRPSDQTWYSQGPGGIATQWGISGDVPVPADFNGDGRADVAVFRPSDQTWYSQGPGGIATQWGTPNDVPVPGDYDRDGDADVAVFRRSNASWYVQSGLATQWGAPGDIPVVVPAHLRAIYGLP